MPQVHLIANKDDAFATAIRRIWPAVDDQGAILGAHLVVEALLFRFVQTRVSNPKSLDAVQWTFRQITVIAQSLRQRRNDERWLWNTVSELNYVRNRLSHDIEISDFPNMLERLYKAAGHHIDIHAPGADPSEREANKLKYFLLILCGVVRNLQDNEADI